MGGGEGFETHPLRLYCLIAHIRIQGVQVELWALPNEGEGNWGAAAGLLWMGSAARRHRRS